MHVCATVCVVCRALPGVAVQEWVKRFETAMQALQIVVRLETWLAHAGRWMQVGGVCVCVGGFAVRAIAHVSITSYYGDALCCRGPVWLPGHCTPWHSYAGLQIQLDAAHRHHPLRRQTHPDSYMQHDSCVCDTCVAVDCKPCRSGCSCCAACTGCWPATTQTPSYAACSSTASRALTGICCQPQHRQQ